MTGGRSEYWTEAQAHGKRVCTVIRRHANGRTPEGRLWITVLCQAVIDYYGGVSNQRPDIVSHRDAKHWFDHCPNKVAQICDYAGIEPTLVYDLLRAFKANEGPTNAI